MSSEPRRVNKKQFRELAKHPYSLHELTYFYRACYELYRHIVVERPDVIIAPLRGAEPIVKTIRLIASLEKKSSLIPLIVYPRTGEQHKVERKNMYESLPPQFEESMTPRQKKRELDDMISRVFGTKNGKRHKSIFLIDEAFSGGSVSTHYRLIDQLIREHSWNASLRTFSVTTKHQKVSQKSSDYLRLLREGRITEVEVPWLFTTDSPFFLQPLIAPKKTFLTRIRRTVLRPGLGLSRQAIEGRAQLFEDIQSIWNQHISEKTSYKHFRITKRTQRGLGRLPMHKPR